MVVEAPPPPAVPDSDVNATGQDVDAGVIEDARRRQRRHQRIGGSVLALAAAGALLVGMGAGGSGGSGGGRTHLGRSAPDPHRGQALASLRTAFPDAPASQPNSNGVEGDTCRLAVPNRYLPARAGCVTARRADINGDGRPDLVVVYSILGHEHPTGFDGAPPALAKDFFALRAYLEVVFAGGGRVTTAITQPKITHAAAIAAISRVNDDPGAEVFLWVTGISSGDTVAAYGLHKGRLAPAGAMLSYGGDSAAAAGFDCLSGSPPRLIQRSLLLLGPTIYGWWQESDTVYAWHGPKLVRISHHTFHRHGAIPSADRRIGRGCIRGAATGVGTSGVGSVGR